MVAGAYRDTLTIKNLRYIMWVRALDRKSHDGAFVSRSAVQFHPIEFP